MQLGSPIGAQLPAQVGPIWGPHGTDMGMLTGGNVGLGSITDFDVAIRTEKTEMLVLLKDRQL